MVDPIKQENEHDADYIFITHPHWDHFSSEDILKIKKDTTKIIGPKDIEKECIEMGFSKESIVILSPNTKKELDTFSIQTILSYNTNKNFHPQKNEWLGYVITFENTTYYIPGDTDVIPEMETLCIDICFIPIGGTYTMNAKEAALIINKIEPKKVIPIHYGMVVGSKEDYDIFKDNVNKNIEVQELIK